MSSTRLSAILDGILEAGWLAAIVVTPLFFNIYSSRVFEPDKLTTLRSIALVMSAVWLVRWVEERASGRQGSRRITWRTPLVLPTLLMILAYLVSTAFSLTPYTSFFGSYQRLQGTFTTFSYIVIFFILLDRLHSRAQVDRLITTLIINSLPIALYGFVQHAGRDPLPWGGDVVRRVASNMGNAIFVAAYLIMAVPPTLSRIVDAFRSILDDEEAGTLHVLQAAAYIFIFLVQVIAIWYTKSRGPLLGLLAGVGVWIFVGLLTLQQRGLQTDSPSRRGLLKDLGQGMAFGLLTILASGAAGGAVYLLVRAGAGPDSSLPQFGALTSGGLVMAGFWLTFVVNRRGWRWLWASALVLAILAVALFFAVNPGGPLHEWAVNNPAIGRVARVLEVESGTGKVRALIWEGGLKMILPHEPIQYPPTILRSEWRPDPFNAIRILVGYGPESMYVGYNRFYPPPLGQVESRTASPDRSHNETLDSLIITGLLGFVAYIWLFGSLFYFGLRWLGLLPTDWRRRLFFGLLVGGALLALAIVLPTIGPHFFCLAIPIGMVGGLFLYLLVYALSRYADAPSDAPSHPHTILLMGLLATFVAHFVEINFGIAIASTRTTFWALAGVFVLLGLQRVAEQREEQAATVPPPPQSIPRSRRRRRRRAKAPQTIQRSPIPLSWLWPTFGAATVGALILGTLAYDFVNNVERLRDPLQVFWRSLTVIAIPASRPPRTSLGILMVFGMTWLAIGLLTVAQMVRLKVVPKRETWTAALIALLVPLAAWLIFGLVLAGRHAHIVGRVVQDINDVMQVAEFVADQVSVYYAFLFATILLGGLALAGGNLRAGRWATPAGLLALLIAALSWIAYGLVGVSGGAFPLPGDLALATALGIAGSLIVGGLLYYLIPSLGNRLEKIGWGEWTAAFVAAIVLFVVPIFAAAFNLQPIRADIVYKQGDPWDRQRQFAVSIPHYQRAVELAPKEDFYYLYLGRALLEYASSLEDVSQQTQALQETERVLLQAQAIAPLNTDHSANLARMYRRWAELPAGRDHRESLLNLASRYYETATTLSPNNPILWNEWATLYYYGMGDKVGYQRCISRSLELDSEFEQTWLIVGDVRAGEGDLEGAAEAYRTALEIKPRQPRVWNALGRVYLQLGRSAEAADALLQSLELAPNARDAWDTHRLLAIAYYQLGRLDQALAEAQTALQMAPEDQRSLVEELILQIQQPPPSEGGSP
ncbi:MAG TPA: tetratricopeptide repeat protein [Thermoflexia bacterium]|nr:tetratricopeptide repeat protein [Thermoflexia bacterium]